MLFNKIYLKYLDIYAGFIWILYAVFYYEFIKNGYDISAGCFSLTGQCGLDLFLLILLYSCYIKSDNKNRKIYLFFSASFLASFFADGIYNLSMNVLDMRYFSNINSFFEIPFIFFLLFQVVAWGFVFFTYKSSFSNQKKYHYIPYCIAAILMFVMFIYGISWKIKYLSLVGIYQIIDTILEVIGFTLSALCLTRAKDSALRLISIGYLTIISSDLMIRYDVVSGLMPFLSFFETTWVLGLTLMLLGFLKSKQKGVELLELNSLQSNIAILLLSFCLVFLVFFTFSSHLFAMQSTVQNSIVNRDVLSLLIPLSILAIIASKFISIKISLPLENLEKSVSQYLHGGELVISHDSSNHANHILEFIAFEKFIYNALDLHQKKLSFEIEFAKLATQVAHDIRSPIVALDVVIRDLKHIPEPQRILIRNAVNRINDIANNLLSQHKEKNSKNIKPELVSELLTSLVSEKRTQYLAGNFEFSLNIEECAYGKFSMVMASSFNRVFSNLIDNSIDAFSTKIDIKINIKNVDEQNRMHIQLVDNGHGINQLILQKIIKGDCVSTKAKGHGLGLSNAIKIIKDEWAGKFDIYSSEGAGVAIEILLPLTSAPKWFSSDLRMNSGQTIIILDDDESIHQAWKKRLNIISNNFNYINFYNPEKLLSWYQPGSSEDIIFLIDYEFIGHNKNGIDVINQLKIADFSYLVTSRYDDFNIQERCIEHNLKVIPKTFVANIPIILSNPKATRFVDLIFIDDDVSLTSAWVLYGLSKGKKIATYNSINDFQKEINLYDLSTAIFIDSNLQNSISGENFAKEMFHKGYTNIYLATGYAQSEFPDMYWIKDIVGKQPPF